MKTFKDHPEFKPNLSPQQILKMGAFGGTYSTDSKNATI